MKAAFEINGLEWYKYNRYNISYLDVKQNIITIKQTYMHNNMTMDWGWGNWIPSPYVIHRITTREPF